jgi:CRISPR-associated protein Cst2
MTSRAPFANYRGETESNRAVLQKLTDDRFERAVVSPEAIRNALREVLRAYNLPCNRRRLPAEKQLSVEYADYPDPDRFVDDLYFGYMMVDEKQIKAARQRYGESWQPRRDSALRVNLAVSLSPYRHDVLMTQSPVIRGPWSNAQDSALLFREVLVTSFQFPFALNLADCRVGQEPYTTWFRYFLRAIGELSNVAGNRARSYFEMAPESIVLRLTDSLVAGFNTYGFTPEGQFPEVVDAILAGDLPGEEFFLGGRLVREMPKDMAEDLRLRGTRLCRTALEALDAVCRAVTGDGLPRGPYGQREHGPHSGVGGA